MFLNAKAKIHGTQLKASMERTKLWALLFFFLVAAWPDTAGAATVVANTLGAMFCNATYSSSVYPLILSASCYVMGAFLGVRSILLFKKHGENPNDSQITRASAHFIGAAFLMTLPSFAGLIQRSVFGKISGGAATTACTATTPTPITGTAGLDTMMTNLVDNIYGPITILVSLISILVGLTLIAKALLRGVKTGTDPRAADPKSIITYLVIGAVLISTGTSFGDIMQSLFGTSTITNMKTFSGIQWSAITGGNAAATAAITKTVNAVLMFVQIIGIMAFVRGWLLLKTAMDGGQATVPQALTFVLGGTMAVNIDKMLDIFDNTFGTNLVTP